MSSSPLETPSSPTKSTLTLLNKPTLNQKIKLWLSEVGNQIPLAVCGAIILGVLLNTFLIEKHDKDRFQSMITLIGLPGDLWIRALKSIVIPLILTSMIMSMQALQQIPGGGGKIAKGALGFYLASTIFSLIEGVVFVVLIMIPNLKGMDWSQYGPIQAIPEATVTITEKTTSLVLAIIPDNIISSMANNDLVAVITAGVVIGCLLKDTKDKPSVFSQFVVEIQNVVSVIVHFLIRISPIGIFFLILPNLMATSFSSIMGALSWYIITLFVALSFHMFVFYPLIYLALVRENPFPFFRKFLPVATTAFGTASSAAAMPYGMECSHKAGIRPYIYQFLVPLGTALNMNGTAIHFPIQIAFLALSTGRELTIVDFILLIFVAFLATIGATPIPGAGIAFMMMMMSSLSIPECPMLKLVIAMEWLTERPETVVNCLGDPIASAFCQKTILGIAIDPTLNEVYDKEEGKVVE